MTYSKILRSDEYKKQKVVVLVRQPKGRCFVMGLFGRSFLESKTLNSAAETLRYMRYMIKKYRNTKDPQKEIEHPMGFIRRY